MDIKSIEPITVMRFFEEISSIPRGSGNTSKIAEYCKNFAKSRGLEYICDSSDNIIIFANGTKGYENSSPIILQGHIDMVCEKNDTCIKDMSSEGITLLTDGKYIFADGTTLGADDGIAVAYILAILDSDNIAHPPIEAVLTSDEEIGLIGANKIDLSSLKGTRMINIDSEEEGILTVGCAGGVRVRCALDLESEEINSELKTLSVNISGLLGGHSGVDIGKNRINANKLIAEILSEIQKITDIHLSRIDGGTKNNVIANSASAVFSVNKEISDLQLSSITERIVNKYKDSEHGLTIDIAAVDSAKACLSLSSAKKLIDVLLKLPDGVQTKNKSGMIQSSLNIGELSLDGENVHIGMFVRSNLASDKEKINEKIKSVISEANGHLEFFADYPAWEYNENSPLRDLMSDVYEEMYGQKPQIITIHAGLECGILSEKIKNADIVSIGPDLENVHTVNERMNIASAKRCWEYLLKVLEKCK